MPKFEKGNNFEENLNIEIKSKKKKWGKIFFGGLFFVIFILISVFAWRVIFFSNLIKTGEINVWANNFIEKQSQSSIALKNTDLVSGFNVVSLDDPYLGSDQAKVIIVGFFDFACPFCKQSSFIIQTLANKYGDQIKIIVRDFPVTELHPRSIKISQAVNCAEQQGKYWEYFDKIFINQDKQNDDDLLRYAQELNLDLAQYRVCLASSIVKKEIMDDYQAGLNAGVYGTPTFFINGNKIPGSIPEDVLIKMIDSILTR